jgi:hypothetical protein
MSIDVSPDHDLSTIRRDGALPQVPTYTESQQDAGVSTAGLGWVKGNHKISRTIMVMHNPSKSNSHSDLDMRQKDFALGLGIYDLKLFSDVVSELTGDSNILVIDLNSLLSAGPSILERLCKILRQLLQYSIGDLFSPRQHVFDHLEMIHRLRSIPPAISH